MYYVLLNLKNQRWKTHPSHRRVKSQPLNHKGDLCFLCFKILQVSGVHLNILLTLAQSQLSHRVNQFNVSIQTRWTVFLILFFPLLTIPSFTKCQHPSHLQLAASTAQCCFTLLGTPSAPAIKLTKQASCIFVLPAWLCYTSNKS